jgi:hypothetical protein
MFLVPFLTQSFVFGQWHGTQYNDHETKDHQKEKEAQAILCIIATDSCRGMFLSRIYR